MILQTYNVHSNTTLLSLLVDLFEIKKIRIFKIYSIGIWAA